MGFFKKQYILTSAVFFAVSSVLCAKNFSFNLIPYFAVETSVIEEAYYYEDYSKYADEMCSLLEWEQKPSYIFGVEGIFNLNKFVFFFGFFRKTSSSLWFNDGFRLLDGRNEIQLFHK